MTCVVIPAAGRGSRLGLEGPKILAPIDEHTTIWDVLCDRAVSVAEQVHVVLSPAGLEPFREALAKHPHAARVTTSIQDVPRGMGDAIFGCREHWQSHDHLMVMWGDQVGLSRETMRAVKGAFGQGPHVRVGTKPAPTLVLPLARDPKPYVEYLLDADGRLVKVLQSREGDATTPNGRCDVGLFGMSVAGLAAAWDQFEANAAVGAQTGEVNFLPFMPFLSQTLGWNVRVVDIADPDEARGVNTTDDLEFHRLRMAKLGASNE